MIGILEIPYEIKLDKTIAMTKGETNLDILIRNMHPVLDARVFVFCHVPADAVADDGVLNAAIMTFREREGLTCILEQGVAEGFGLETAFPSRMVTLNVHSALEAVGFLARIIPELAKLGMGVNPVAGYFHDHLFIPQAFADRAMTCLEDLAR